MRAYSFLFLILASAVTLASTASILDLFDWVAEGKRSEDGSADSTATRSCACNGPSCMCCVDFNLTYIDLGGPGCVRMKYISQSDGIAVNVSYGESLLHSEQVKGPNPEPTCMSLLTNLAQVCARFSTLEPHQDGLRGCMALEPKLLGDVTSHFHVGCFTMGPEGMKMEPGNSTYASLLENQVASSNTTQNETEDLNEEDILAAVNETAEQGLAFFGNLLGFTFGNSEENSTESSSLPTNELASSTASPTR